MSHLTEEQFEDILRAAAHVPEHLDYCPLCRTQLDDSRAIAQRVPQAFSSIGAPPGLADRIRTGIAARSVPAAAARRRVRIIPLHLRRRLWSGLAAAAAILILAVPIGLYVHTGSPANAAPVALAQIHHANLASLGQLFNNDDPRALCQYLEDRVGHSPAMLCTGSGLAMCGCCVRQFQGRPVASYVVTSERIPISVIAVTQSPEALGMTLARGPTVDGRDLWQTRHGCCNIASVRLGGYSYCAIGQVTQEELAAVLGTLLE